MRRIGRVSVAAPAYNEAEGVPGILRTWTDYLRTCDAIDSFEIVVCNDGSQDNTGAILDELAAEIPELKPVHHPVNRGAAAALTSAIRATTGDWVLLLDSDDQYPVDNVVILNAMRLESTQAIFGFRRSKQDSLFAKLGSAASGWLCNWFHNSEVRDFNCACKLIHGQLLRSLHLEAKGLNYSGEVASKLLECGAQIAQAEVRHVMRIYGRSNSQTFRAAWHRLLFVVYIGMRQALFHLKVLEAAKSDRFRLVSLENSNQKAKEKTLVARFDE
jgi:dolichol-phosphate mannosyltransferase